MTCARCPPFRRRVRLLGPLCSALLLHAGALAGAATVGFTLAAEREEPPAPLALALGERPELAPEPEPAGSEGRDALPPRFEAPEVEPLDDVELDVELLAALPPLSEEAPSEEHAESFSAPAAEPVPPLVEPASPDSAATTVVARSREVFRTVPLMDGGGGAGAGGAGVGGRAQPGAVVARRAGSAIGPGALLGGGAARGRSGTGTGRGSGSGRGVVEMRAIEAPPPLYPSLSRRAGEEGSVLCRLHVSDAGDVTRVDVVESSGFERLDSAAQRMLLRWRFEPRRLDGHAVAAMLEHRVTFRLES